MVDTVVTAKPQFVGTSPEDSNLSFRRACITFSITLDQSVLENPLTFSVGLFTGRSH